ncbi:FG-GAP repeat domain-containing protein [Arenibacterium sp. LLYu02]|uniref:FG-GAP repeat domain-containing protein n=1 Tax=Arenibacterium sp. LLYu02 TaxID=3404132 RepID=UPI003B2181FC
MARRPPLRVRPRLARRAGRAVCLALAAMVLAAPVLAGEHWRIVRASFAAPTTRYAHAVLGDGVEYTRLVIEVDTAEANPKAVLKTGASTVDLPLTRVFEDIAPRLWDVTGDGLPEVVVIETDMALGAQLAIYDAAGTKIAATPHIGQTFRWLAPIGAADLDGDGRIEIAYIDRPHLAKTLRIWRFQRGRLEEVASAQGLTNHRIGEGGITSGLRDCGQGVEIITVDADWRRVMASRLREGVIESRDLGPYDPQLGLDRALTCARP